MVFFVNGESLGVAAQAMPEFLFAVVDLYGKCVKVSITHPVEREHNNDECLSCDSAESECELWSNSLLEDIRNIRLQPRPNPNVSLTLPANELDTPIGK